VPPLRAFNSIVLICQRAADKISGGRSPNEHAFESRVRAIEKPYVPGLNDVHVNRIQTVSGSLSERATPTPAYRDVLAWHVTTTKQLRIRMRHCNKTAARRLSATL
jgi:hypothetical protein